MTTKTRLLRTLWQTFTQVLLRRRFVKRLPLGMELLEDRITPVGDWRYQAGGAAALTLRQEGGELQIVETDAPSVVHAAKPLADITGGVQIEGNGFDVNLT